MKLEKRFEQLQNLLMSHHGLIQREVMERYPLIDSPYSEWVDSIQHYSTDELIALENIDFENLILPDSYKELLIQIKSLTDIPVSDIRPGEIPKPHLKKMTHKKRHEISLLLNQLSPYDHFIDIGSGAGHLSGVLLDNNDKKSLCIDLDAKIQAIGVKKFEHIKDRLNFVTANFDSDFKLPPTKVETLIGLHSCGDLSVDLIDFFIENSLDNLFNYGCCYHKLSKYNLSSNSHLELSNHALTMAAKSYKKMTQREFFKREKVKRFRYTLHFIMQDHLNADFATLGNARTSDYEGSFSDYCYKYFRPSQSLNSDQLEEYYYSYQSQYERYLRFGIIRSHFSRAIEIYLILDRALYLKESGMQVSIEEVFDRSLSPRNICLKAHAKEA